MFTACACIVGVLMLLSAFVWWCERVFYCFICTKTVGFESAVHSFSFCFHISLNLVVHVFVHSLSVNYFVIVRKSFHVYGVFRFVSRCSAIVACFLKRV